MWAGCCRVVPRGLRYAGVSMTGLSEGGRVAKRVRKKNTVPIRREVNKAIKALTAAMERLPEHEIDSEVKITVLYWRFALKVTEADIVHYLKQLPDSRMWRTYRQVRHITKSAKRPLPN